MNEWSRPLDDGVVYPLVYGLWIARAHRTRGQEPNFGFTGNIRGYGQVPRAQAYDLIRFSVLEQLYVDFPLQDGWVEHDIQVRIFEKEQLFKLALDVIGDYGPELAQIADNLANGRGEL